MKHKQLLDAAHIVPDKEEAGIAAVTNDISLCKIHHAVYDQNFLGISPDYEVNINHSLLEEVDGPMLKHGFQEMHKTKLNLPRREENFPDKEKLEIRFEQFLTL